MTPQAKTPGRLQVDGGGSTTAVATRLFDIIDQPHSPGASPTTWHRTYITEATTGAQRLCRYSKFPKIKASITRLVSCEVGPL